MNKNSLLSFLQIPILLLIIVLTACATAPPEETWKPVTMATTEPIRTAQKIFFVFDVSVENRDKISDQSLSNSSTTVQNWTTFGKQFVKELNVLGVNADFVISTDKIPPDSDRLRNIGVPKDVTHVVSLVETRALSRGDAIVDAWWTAVVYQANDSKRWDEKRHYETISLYKYKFVGWSCFVSNSNKDLGTDCLKKHTTFHLDNLKKIGIL
jgi:hypothetical protein